MKVLVTDPISNSGKAILTEAGIEVVDMISSESEAILKVLPQIDGWIVRSGTTVTGNHLEKAEKLKVIGRAGVGIDNIDLSSATLHGVVVMNTPAANTFSAAEHTIALILSLARNVHYGYESLKNGKWNRNALVGTELRGKTLGVVGLGKIGTEVVKRLHSFGMNILGYDPFIKPEHYDLDYVKFTDLDNLCEKSDIITIHVPKMENTQGMFDLVRLKLMKPTAFIVNCARGGIIVEEDIKKALDEGAIAGAAIDVFEHEPPDNSPLIGAKNILFTPHLGASTREAKEGVSQAICLQVRDFLLEGKVENGINIPISDISLLQALEPYLHLAEKLGMMHQQLIVEPPEKISVETQGVIEEVKLVTLAFLKGFLQEIHGSSVNFVNAAAVAESRGIQIQETYGYGSGDYSNIISTQVFSNDYSLTIRGSLFSEKHPRVIYFDGFRLDLSPNGYLLIVYNKDVPGVVGKVGTLLGNMGVNIAGYQLSRKDNSNMAMGIIRLDAPLDEDAMRQLQEIDEIIRTHQLNLG